VRSILNRVLSHFRLPPVPVVTRDLDLVRETSQLRIEQRHVRKRLTQKMDRVDDMFARALASARGED